MSEIKSAGGASINIVADDSQARKVFESFLKFGNNVEKAFKGASSAIETTVKKAEGMAKSTSDLSNKTNSMKTNVIDSYGQMKSKVTDLTSGIDKMKTATESYSNNAINGYKKAGEGIKSVNSTISSDTKQMFSGMSTDNQTFNQQLVGSMKASTGELKNSFGELKTSFGVVASSILDLIKRPVDAVMSIPQKVVSATKQIASSVSSGFSTAKNLAISQVNSIKASILDIPNKAKSASDSVKNFFVTGFNSVTMAASSMVSKTASSIASLPSKSKAAATSMKDSFVNGIKAIPSATSAMVSSVTSKVKSLGSSFASVGGSIKNSFSNGFNSVKEKASSSFQSVKNSIVSGAQQPAEEASLSIGKIVTALGLVKVASKAWNVVTGSMDGAISRFDTLNKFPKVLSAMGVGFEEAESAKNKLIDGIDGLPTRLDEVSSIAQRMFTSFGSIDKAAESTIALNNSLLGSGSDAEKAARGTEQYLKVLQTGKMEMDTWSTLSETMDTGLVKIAESFGYTGKSAKNDLYAALQSGTITIDQFNDKMIELGTGTGIMAQLAKENSIGMATSFKNLKTAVVNGLEKTIRKIDEATKSLTGKNIAEHVISLKPVVSKTFEAIQNSIDKLVVFLEKNKEKIESVINSVKNAFKSIDKEAFFEGFKESFNGLASSGREFLVQMKPIVEFIKNTLVKLITQLGDGNFSKGLGKLPMLLLKVTVGFKALSKVLKVLSKFNIKIPFFGGKGGKSKEGLNPLSGIADGIKGFTKNAGNLVLLFGIIKIIEEAAQAIKDVNDKVPNDLAVLAVKLGAMAIAISAMVGVTALLGKLPKKTMATGGVILAGIVLEIELLSEAVRKITEKVPSDIKDFSKKMANIGIAIASFTTLIGIVGKASSKNPKVAISGLIMIGAFGIELYALVDVIKKINDKITSNVEEFSKKIANISIAISAMGILIGIVGKLANKNPMSAILGLSVVALIGVELVEFANVVNEINNKVTANISGFSKKIANIAIAISSFSALLGVVGSLSNKNPVATITGLGVLALIGVELYAFADVMNQINKKVPSNIGKFASKMANIVIAIGSFSLLVAVIGGLVSSGIGALVGGAGLLTIALVAADLMLVAEAISQVDKKVPSNFDKVKGKIESITKVVKYIADANLGGPIALIKNIYGALNTAVVTGTIMLFIELAKKLNTLNSIEVDPELAKKKIEMIRKALEEVSGSSIGELIGHLIGLGDTKILADTIDTLITIAYRLTILAVIPFNGELVKLKIISIQDVLSAISGANIFDIINHWLGLGDISILSETIDKLIQIANKLNTFNTIQLDVLGTQFKIIGIQSVLSLFDGSGLIEIIGHFMAKIDISILSDTIDKFVTIANQLVSLTYIPFNAESSKKRIVELKDILYLIDGAGLKELISHALQLGDMSILNKIVDEFLEIAQTFVKLEKEKFNKKKVETTIKNVKEIIDLLSSEDGIFSSLKKMITGKIDSATVEESKNTLDIFLKIAVILSRLNSIKFDKKDAENKISAINGAVELIGNSSIADWIGKMVKSAELQEARKSIQAMILLIEPLNRLGSAKLEDLMINARITQLSTILQGLGRASLSQYFGSLMKSSELGEANKSVIALIDIVNNLGKLGNTAKSIDPEALKLNGKSIADTFVNGVTEGLEKLPSLGTTYMDKFINAMMSRAVGLIPIGILMGNAITGGIMIASDGMANAGNVASGKLIMSLISNGFKAGAVGKQWMQFFVTGFSSMIAFALITITLFANTFALRLSSYNPRMRLIGTQWVQNLVNGFMSLLSMAITRVNQLAIQMVNTLMNHRGNMNNAGRQLMESLAQGIRNSTGSVSSAIRNVVGTMLNGISKGVNGVIGGVNFVLSEVASDKKVPTWSVPAYANGTDGHPADGPALINDQTGSKFRELVQLPNGESFIAKARNVMMNLPKGAKVLNATMTERLMKARQAFSSMPAYKKGIGDINVFDYLDKPKEILEQAVDAKTDLTGIVNPWLSMTRSAVTLMTDRAVPFIKDALDSYMPSSGSFAPHFGAPFTLSSGYGVRPGLYGDFHTGIDFAAPAGTPIPAQYGGKVEEAGNVTGLGLHVGIKVAQNLWALYGHMSKILSTVGQNVKAGETIGLVGSTGWATGPHVHYELRTGGVNGQHVDPNAYGADAGSGPAGAGVERWRSSLVKALGLNGLPKTANYVNAWLRQIQTESGGNEKAIGGNDGLADGNAMGLLQTKPGTFNAYKFPGYGNIMNGFHNMLAAINYAKNRYGYADMLQVIGHGHGYENGGIVNKHGLYEMAEGNKAEMIIPLEKPKRAMELIFQALGFLQGRGLQNTFSSGAINLEDYTTKIKANVMDYLNSYQFDWGIDSQSTKGLYGLGNDGLDELTLMMSDFIRLFKNGSFKVYMDKQEVGVLVSDTVISEQEKRATRYTKLRGVKQ